MPKLKDKNKYYKQREILVLEKTKEICSRLPEYCTKYVFAREVAANSKYAYAQDLESFFKYLIEHYQPLLGRDPSTVTLEEMSCIKVTDLEEYSIFMKQSGYTANTRSRRLSSVRGMFKYLCRTERLESNCTEKLEMPTAKMRDEDHEIRYLSEDEVKEFLYRMKTNTVFEGTRQKRMEKWKIRNYAIAALFLHTGMRLSECVGIDIDDVDLKNQCVYVHRKGGKRSDLYMNEACCEALSAYLEQRSKMTPEDGDENALFISAKGRRLSARMVEKMIGDCAKACNFRTTSVHSLRRSYGTQFYNQVGDVYLLSDNLGHSSVDVTAKHYAKMLNSRRQQNKKINLYEEPEQ